MNVICLEEDAFYELVEQVVERLSEKLDVPVERWIDGPDAMARLGVKSPTTLQRYRDEGLIEFTQPSRKVILYDVTSIDEFLEKKRHKKF